MSDFSSVVHEAAIAIADARRERRGSGPRPSAFDRLSPSQQAAVQQDAEAAVRAALYVLGKGKASSVFVAIAEHGQSGRWGASPPAQDGKEDER